MFGLPSPSDLAQRGRVVTLGMFIIDHFEVHDDDGNTVAADAEAMGGGGLYAMAAARMFLPPRHVGFIVDCGTDFPANFHAKLEALGIAQFRPREGLTTRALNLYSGKKIGEGHQTFKYLSPRININLSDYLADPPRDLQPEWVHVVCDTTRADSILLEAASYAAKGWKGKMAWEPLIRTVEPGCTGRYVQQAKGFAIFSPNEIELQAILESATSDAEVNAKRFHDLCAASSGDIPAIVVRSGPRGAYTLSSQWSGWVPAYWRPEEPSHIVDVTGGGNSFLGGLLAGLLLTNDYRAATIYASAAASFAIEQKGIPQLTTVDSEERWNNTIPWTRLRDMAERVDDLEHKA